VRALMRADGIWAWPFPRRLLSPQTGKQPGRWPLQQGWLTLPSATLQVVLHSALVNSWWWLMMTTPPLNALMASARAPADRVGWGVCVWGVQAPVQWASTVAAPGRPAVGAA
jgi:hypothetical protein